MLKKAPQKNDLIDLFDAVGSLAAENCQKLSPIVEEVSDVKDYFFGVLQRMFVFSNDISTILRHSHHNSISSILIIGRCIYDDYLKIKYVDSFDDKEEMVTKLDADSVKHNFKRLNELKELNLKYFGGQFEFYPTEEKLIEVKESFLKNSSNLKYLVNPENVNPEKIKFKSCYTVRDMVDDMQSKQTNDDIGRAYYFWGEWSSFVHFSSLGYKLEMSFSKDSESQHSLNRRLQELAVIACTNIRVVLRYFHYQYQYEPIDSKKIIHSIYNVPISD